MSLKAVAKYVAFATSHAAELYSNSNASSEQYYMLVQILSRGDTVQHMHNSCPLSQFDAVKACTQPRTEAFM